MSRPLGSTGTIVSSELLSEISPSSFKVAISVEHKADGTDALYIAEGTSSQKELKANLGYIRFRTTEVIDSDSYGLVELVIRGATLQPQNFIQEGRSGSEKFMIVSLESSVHSAAAIFGSSPSFNIHCISGPLTWLSRGTLKAR
ncbi:uncharacterized protein QC763_0041020 [Podospora pseudopauciseta]|uniref:Uncharacterized protein n=1 Tax=Podospora pseudopauciseta TaxID=2093780 RepID=A0ABR0HR93_9PEZI|nr:hypothetical protein QC763_0041020 [Podospora pseudopauciseta]